MKGTFPMKKLISLLFVLLLFAGCSGGDKPKTDVQTTAPAATETTAATTEVDYFEVIGKHDFNGRTFTIDYSADQLGAAWPYFAEQTTGEVLNDAVFNRDRAVEEQYNVKIASFNAGGDFSKPADTMVQAVIAGDETYQLVMNHMYGGFNAAVAQGAVADFAKMPYIDLDQPWWNQTIKSNLSIDGVLLTEVSDLVYAYYDVIFFNKEIMKDNGIPFPYAKVKDGTWTWDYVAEVTKNITKDKNGDGKYDVNDVYGYLVDNNKSIMTRLIHANGMVMAQIGDDGKPTLSGMMSDKMMTVLQKYYKLVWEDNRSFIAPFMREAEGPTCTTMFRDGQGMFMHTATSKLPILRDAEFEFGIVPLPKYDEKQEDYRSMASSQMLLLPAVMSDPEFVGLITEALSYAANKYVVPVIFDIVYENKWLRDEESQEMFRLIRGQLVYDFNWIYGNGNNMAYFVGRTVGAKSEDFASYYASNVGAAQKILDDVVENVRKLYSGK